MDQTNIIIGDRWSEARAGLQDVAPVMIAAVPIGLLFGALSVAKGLSPAEVTLMSALVFAGGAQFAAIESWTNPAAIAALAFSTLLINARHVLMGASFAPKLRATRVQKLVGFGWMTDESWALAERRAVERPVTLSYWWGMVVPLHLAWTGATGVGSIVGALMGDPSRFGADFAFTAMFIGLIAGFGRGRVTVAAVAVSAAVAALVHMFIGAPWHVACGALAGIAAAYGAAGTQEQP